ncbi:MAG: bifunctional folylpolyglutamate synthase/dihydrofolate synthase [Spirochaetes bacterium]|nr:bifunctional folylpolyglutamate synthase/dihydrofolate synthase [Spirochaetota bacterium]
MPAVTAVRDIFSYFLTFVNMEQGHKVDFRLDRILGMLSALGSPELSVPCFHVAGSKGKGSVSAMLASILEAEGLATGLYTSPHILDYRERITRAGTFLPDGTYLHAFSALAPILEARDPSAFAGGELPSFFELSTVLAFLCFRDSGFGAAVYEVGLGGRLDSTNVVLPEASVITPIELEHTEWLGRTIREIAGEKAGIIKDGVPVFTSAVHPDALEVFRATAVARSARLRVLSEEAGLSDISVGLGGTSATVEFRDPAVHSGPLELSTPMIGRVQAENAALAMLASRLSTFRPSVGSCVRGIARASLPARFEVISRDPTVVLDGAHTPGSIRNAIGTWSSLFPSGGVLLFACAIDKHHAEMAGMLKRCFASVIVTKPGSFKPSDPAAVAGSFASAGFAVTLEPDTAAAYSVAILRATSTGSPLLVTGSFYLCSEIMKLRA